MKYDLCIIGGAGHVGLPFGVTTALSGIKTVLLDVNMKSLEKIKSGVFPFKEKDGKSHLNKALNMKTLFVSVTPEVISESKSILLIIGTPVDKHLNPDFKCIFGIIEKYISFFRRGQVLILRSTVYPGTSERIQRYFNDNKKGVQVAFCPERVVEGDAFQGLKDDSQIISAFNKSSLDEVNRLFKRFVNSSIVVMEPIEAELAKLFSNSWRYVKFALGNQFYMIARSHGLNYNRIFEGMKKDYPRNKGLPGPGFSAGPCLLKDTMQLSAFTDNTFFMGHSAMLINENFPKFVIGEAKLKLKEKLNNKTLGILGMTFKAESDDIRDSLSFKLRKIAETEFGQVLCHDFYFKDKTFSKLPDLIKKSDVIILATPHRKYNTINPSKYKDKIFIDVWDFWKGKANH